MRELDEWEDVGRGLGVRKRRSETSDFGGREVFEEDEGREATAGEVALDESGVEPGLAPGKRVEAVEVFLENGETGAGGGSDAGVCAVWRGAETAFFGGEFRTEEADIYRGVGAEFVSGENAVFAVVDDAARGGHEDAAVTLALGGGGVFLGADELVAADGDEESEQRGGENETEQPEAAGEGGGKFRVES